MVRQVDPVRQPDFKLICLKLEVFSRCCVACTSRVYLSWAADASSTGMFLRTKTFARHELNPKTTDICLLPIGGTKSHCFSASDILCGPKCVSAQCHRCATEQDGRGALNNVLGSGSERSLLVAASVRPRTKTSRHRVLFVPNISTSIPRLSISIRVRWACPVRCSASLVTCH